MLVSICQVCVCVCACVHKCARINSFAMVRTRVIWWCHCSPRQRTKSRERADKVQRRCQGLSRPALFPKSEPPQTVWAKKVRGNLLCWFFCSLFLKVVLKHLTRNEGLKDFAKKRTVPSVISRNVFKKWGASHRGTEGFKQLSAKKALTLLSTSYPLLDTEVKYKHVFKQIETKSVKHWPSSLIFPPSSMSVLPKIILKSRPASVSTVHKMSFYTQFSPIIMLLHCPNIFHSKGSLAKAFKLFSPKCTSHDDDGVCGQVPQYLHEDLTIALLRLCPNGSTNGKGNHRQRSEDETGCQSLGETSYRFGKVHGTPGQVNST